MAKKTSLRVSSTSLGGSIASLDGARFYMRKYGLTREEADYLLKRPDFADIINKHEDWRDRHGWPAPDSSLARGHLLDLLKGKR